MDVRNLVKNRNYISKHLKIQPSETEGLDFWDYEYLLDDLKDIIEKKNQQNSADNQNTPSFSDMKSQMKLPSVSMPKMK